MDWEWKHPEALWALAAVPGLALLLAWSAWQRRRAWERWAEAPMRERLRPAGAGRGWFKSGLLLAAVALAIAAAARPRFGDIEQEVFLQGADVLVLLDTSRSMLAEDVRPSRLQRAKSDVRDLLHRLEGDRIGLLAFAGAPTVLVPLTTDYDFFETILDSIDVDSAPRGGSLLADAILKGLDALPQAGGRDQVLLLISDGGGRAESVREAADAAMQRGVVIIAVGLGDPADGAPIPIEDAQGRRTHLTEEGEEILSKLDEPLLREAALRSGGAYVPVRTQRYDLGELYETHLQDLARGQLRSERRQRKAERYQWFLGAALSLLLLDMLIRPARRPDHGLS